ncbi:non-hydrolyzing UDP-N-acetylglucosamine 2-epimerase [Desulfosarcina cetonica]|uniref:non-hydrolyzing UDP-N-acetylglucosamine 2-epimerase n=1 Tax=Desulfosarcina cetonica TaxID=90730 RepID=UPI000A625498|nr:UDP-N-acetylglucosamine 2-epimerase (non-hydrolyzing) [Desulfosarcina cetonica]
MLVHLVAGARPNFMKIAPIYRIAQQYPNVTCRIIHTGQHYDYEMSQAFFDDFGLPEPDHFLHSGSGSHAKQTAKIMIAFEAICETEKPDVVIVVGDVNSTLACSVVAKKMLIPVAHVEAGLRSFDLTMPEEINRMVTDAISDYFFVTEDSGVKNLKNEGKPHDRIFLVGHVMIDNLFHQIEQIKRSNASLFASQQLKKRMGAYAFMTLHRPSNVDKKENFEKIVHAINIISTDLEIVFPVHPRTRKMIDRYGIQFSDRVHLMEPLPFRESLFLWKDARVVLTDSGGLQEETTALKIPCLTLRQNTERPITIEIGSNKLAGTSSHSILEAFQRVMGDTGDDYQVPSMWDARRPNGYGRC